MASSSTSPMQKSFKYDVFLSFRGEDTRKTFVDHLYHALDNKGIITYKDDEKIEKGERIDDQLLRSIEESRFYIIVFSKNYASSSWCLDELVKIMECQKMTDHTAYPIFYDVEPTQVRNQSGAVGEAFAKHVEKEDAGRWRDALKEVAGLAGWELKTTVDGHEAKFIQKIVVDISLKLSFFNGGFDDNLVGIEARVENIVSSLEIGSEDVRMIGIKGIGGGGKTTLATAVFYRISDWFDATSFVENVREVSTSSLSGLKELQKQVLSDVSNDQSVVVRSVSDGKNKMIKMLGSRKVLVVLDDVDNIGQLEALAGKRNWFEAGSRIIITTRDEQVLVAHRVNFIHDVNLLSNEEALCLFSRHAFEREIPVEGYEQLSEKVIHYAAGLPLTIKVLGSFLCGRSEHEWVDAIERLKTIPLKETLEKLELSYNGLENDQKEIFLDVVCILKGKDKDGAIRVLESCGFKAQIGLRVLVQKSLITITDYGSLSCHDHIEEMGRNIVRRLHPDQPNRHSRLWITEEVEDILVNDLGTKATRSITLKTLDLHPAIIMNGLRKMRKLRYLHVFKFITSDDNDKYLDTSLYLPDALQSLCWRYYLFRWLPKTFQANELVNLEMIQSNISELWEGGERKVLKKLRFLDLRHSMNLRTFDLGLTPNLEELNLSSTKVSYLNLGMSPHLEVLNLCGCKHFVQLFLPNECSNLKSIDLSGTKVSYLNLGMTPHLGRLNLKNCYSLQEIHAPVGCLENLYFLDLSGCLRFQHFLVDDKSKSEATLKLTAKYIHACPLHPNSALPKFQFKCVYDEPLPLSSGNVEKLISFGLCACTNLESFLESICGLQHLNELRVEGNIPEAVFKALALYRLESLDNLVLHIKEIKHIPDSLYMLENLNSLEFNDCERLEQLPENICRLKCLKSLILQDCILFEKLPEELGRLERLVKLELRGWRSLRDIPSSICNMKCLKSLNLSYCILIEKLPEELGCLECLEELDLRACKSLQDLPKSICSMKCLKLLCLSDCDLIEKLPEELGRLDCLEKLDLTGCTFLRDIPTSICNMKCLKSLCLSGCIVIEKLPEEIGRLERLKDLPMLNAGISCLPQSIYQLKGLDILVSRKQFELYNFTSFTKVYNNYKNEDCYEVKL